MAERKGGVLINSDCLEEGRKDDYHEIGHLFDLLHTFETANGSGLVTRNIGQRNCDVAGDGFCDTPADIPEIMKARTKVLGARFAGCVV
ncbi:MAG: hypothetical protein IPN09_17070 [Bacteroidetes bacterium]|nr:hypothetical protein [Bacteroidota bacterium]